VGDRVDCEAVVAALVDEVACHRPERVGAEAAALVRRAEEEVDSRVPELGVELLVVLDEADRLTLVEDREGRGVVPSLGLLDQLGLADVRPPAGHLGVGDELREPGSVLDPKRPEHDPFAAQLHDANVRQRAPRGTPGAPAMHASGSRVTGV
jgi:hypothetical protein